MSFVRLGLIVAALAVVPLVRAAEPARPAYLDPAQPMQARVNDLVGRMTLEEKVQLLKNASPGVPRLGVPEYDWWNEALHGVARAGEATVFPQAIGLAAMWDPALMQEIAHAIGVEARAKYNGAARTKHAGKRYYGLTFWTPNINIFRDPRWGRGQETYGEDPFLTARTGVAFVRGLQGDDPRHLMAAACAKHFAVHSGPEPERHDFNVAPSAEDYRETYLPAFEALVREARVEIVMTAYNAVYGQPAAVSPLLYQQLEQWGFDGHVTSDCGAIEDLSRTYKVAPDDAGAEALALKAGLNLRCGEAPSELVAAVRRGDITEGEIDFRLGQLLRTQFRLGFYDPAEQVAFNRIAPAQNMAPAHTELALRATRESLVLLKNDGTLPLAPAQLKRVAVIGPSADSVTVLLGNYNGTPAAPVTVLAGLRAALPGVRIDHAQGCDYATGPGGLRPIPRTGLRADNNTGLIGRYFANRDLAGEPVASRRERPVSFDFARDKSRAPAGVPTAGFSTRWQGSLITTIKGDYRLAVKARGGVRLTVDGRRVLDDWTPGEKTREVSLALPGNAELPVTLEYFADGEGALSFEWEPPAAESGYAEALELAAEADVIVYVGGISAQLEGEEMKVDYEGFRGGDRTVIELPAVQQRLLERLVAVGKPLVFVHLSGSAVALPWADAHVNAILQAWYPGQAAGTAIADVLLGKHNPSGRLPVTFYRATSDLPPFEDYSMTNRTYRYFRGAPLYAFGHGLSYTSFAYSNLRVAPGEAGALSVSVDIANTGARDGEEVVQVYATPPAARENQSLSAFGRVALKAGERKTVTLAVTPFALRRWSAAAGDYAIPAGEWTIRVGASSADIRSSAKIAL